MVTLRPSVELLTWQPQKHSSARYVLFCTRTLLASVSDFSRSPLTNFIMPLCKRKVSDGIIAGGYEPAALDILKAKVRCMASMGPGL